MEKYDLFLFLIIMGISLNISNIASAQSNNFDSISESDSESAKFFEENLDDAVRLAEQRDQIQSLKIILPILIFSTAITIGIILIKLKRKKIVN